MNRTGRWDVRRRRGASRRRCGWRWSWGCDDGLARDDERHLSNGGMQRSTLNAQRSTLNRPHPCPPPVYRERGKSLSVAWSAALVVMLLLSSGSAWGETTLPLQGYYRPGRFM